MKKNGMGAPVKPKAKQRDFGVTLLFSDREEQLMKKRYADLPKSKKPKKMGKYLRLLLLDALDIAPDAPVKKKEVRS